MESKDKTEQLMGNEENTEAEPGNAPYLLNCNKQEFTFEWDSNI